LNTKTRIDNAYKSLIGVSIGDAFGESFFGNSDKIAKCISLRELPDTKWAFTDDTVMSIAIYEQLETNGEIDQDSLVTRFCINHDLDPVRGYGATLRRILREIKEGNNWTQVSRNAFDGQGSMGNGAAMRVCPIGAFYYEDLQKVKKQSIKASETTHSNIEAIAGAIAVATGTALATKMAGESYYQSSSEFIDDILAELPDSETKSKILKSKSIPYDYHIETIKNILGNGTNMTAQDTVPFAIWCAAHNLDNFEEGLWKAVSILGDRDTICAIVGGITIMSSKEDKIPAIWKESVENIESSIFRTGNKEA
jgi:ADP-ribosylglycohydrolase